MSWQGCRGKGRSWSQEGKGREFPGRGGVGLGQGPSLHSWDPSPFQFGSRVVRCRLQWAGPLRIIQDAPFHKVSPMGPF